MLSSKDDFRAVIKNCLAANHGRCMDSEEDARLLTDALVKAIFEEMSRYSEPEASVKVEDKVEANLRTVNPADLDKFNDALREGILLLFHAILHLRKSESEARKIAGYTMRKRIEHEDECPLFGRHRDHHVSKLVDQIQHMANTAHQAYHHADGDNAGKPWTECSRPFCRDAFKMTGRQDADE